MAKYIRLNPLKQSLVEDLRMARSWKVLFLWIPKLFRHRLEFTSYIPVPVPFQDFVVSPESLTPQAAAQLSAPAQDAARLGFDAPVYQVMTTLAGETVMTTANCRHTGGEIVARLMHVRLGTVHPPKENLALSLISQLADGRRLVTTSQRPSFDGPPNYLVQRRIGASLEELLALHQQKLVELRPGVAPERIPDKAALAAFIDRNEEEAMQFHLRRGVYEEVSPAELAAKSTAAAVTAAVAGANETDTAVLAEIEKLRNKQGSWRAALMLAVLSFAAFIGLGRARWNWEFVLLLTGVVAFHELGHYVAMRLLHYRNVRMFFVPLLGAAVTGRHYNVKGWQRAVVSLAGPVPGILLGLLLTVIAVLTHNPLVEKTALIMLLINGINLLPFVPLDGGWVLHAVLFSRHFLWETAFLGFAGLSLIGATMLGLGRLWMYLGIFMLVGLPTSYRLARLASRLKQSGLSTTSPDDQSIPPETALAILRELKQVQSPRATVLSKHLASQTLDVFQKLNATPPGVLASILLLLFYLGAGTAAFLGTGVVMASRIGFFPSYSQEARAKPTQPVDPAACRITGATNEAKLEWRAPVLLATFTNAAAAQAAFDAVGKRLAAEDRLTLFGQSVLLSGGTVPGNWPAWFKGQGARVLIECPVSNFTSQVSLSCQAPNPAAATAIQEECETHFNGSWLRTWPPWVDLEGLEPERRQAVEQTRYTWACLHRIERTLSEEPEYKRLNKRLFRRGLFSLLGRRNKEELQQTLDKEQALRQTIYRRELNRLAQSKDARLDQEIIARFDRYWFATDKAKGETFKALEQVPCLRLGTLPLDGNLPASPPAWRAARSGSSDRNQNELHFRYLNFYRTDLGLPALLTYLQQKGCSQFRYEIQGLLEEENDEKEEKAEQEL